MSLDIRYLTNGMVSLYTVINSSVTPVQRDAYKTKEEIPSDIRHYTPDGEPNYVGPDLASTLGVQSFFYPDFPKCHHQNYAGEKCIAESCKFAPKGNWTKCPHFPGYELKGDTYA